MEVTQRVELKDGATGEIVQITHTQPHKTVGVRLQGGRIVEVSETAIKCIVAEARPDLIRWESKLQRRALLIDSLGGRRSRIVAGV